MSFDGKTVLVTGAAKGIGQAVAVHFAREARAWRSSIAMAPPLDAAPRRQSARRDRRWR